MYTKTQLKITVSRGRLRGRVEESKNTGWCLKKITLFGFFKVNISKKLNKVNVKKYAILVYLVQNLHSLVEVCTG